MKILVTIERGKDGSYWCQTEDAILGGYLTATGKTVQEAKEDLMECLAEAKEDLEAEGKVFPEIEFTFKYDLQSFFNYFSFLNVSDIAKRSGINPSLMRQYTSGVKNAGEKTYQRLANCIQNIGRELEAASF
ncbi:MAG: type II toxin-antitoxin system HicB family antitoxin [Bacteroidaceae bacterium]|nr:type II toxin-antitoxin system HicB family antitoxin [Bacteroidaceae bacterium]MBR1902557.1 type II toxin-antitoxin system HicB family antitoxin [Bacteroidaceae bacterium]